MGAKGNQRQRFGLRVENISQQRELIHHAEFVDANARQIADLLLAESRLFHQRTDRVVKVGFLIAVQPLDRLLEGGILKDTHQSKRNSVTSPRFTSSSPSRISR